MVVQKTGIVNIADKTKPLIKTLVHGKICFGSIEVDAIHCPQFSKNLVSGIDLIKGVYYTNW
jgi:hypothetical protein